MKKKHMHAHMFGWLHHPFLVASGILVAGAVAGFTYLKLHDMPAQSASGPILSADTKLYTLDVAALAKSRTEYQSGNAALQKLVSQVKKSADKAAAQPIATVTAKSQTPPGGDKHDYMSLAVYWWPNPATPDGTPYVRRDGKVNPESDSVPDKSNFNTMLDATDKLATAYYFTGNITYAQKAAAQLRAWFVDPATRMNPNLNYAQMIKGKDSDGTGLIDLRYLPQIIDCQTLIAPSGALSESDVVSIKVWLKDYSDWLITSDPGKAQADQPNNHGTWYDAQIIAIASYVGNTDRAKAYVERVKHLIDSQITAEGSQPLELARTNSWDYSILNLEGLLRAAQAAKTVQVDLLNYTNNKGGSIRKATEFLAPYAKGAKQWQYQQISGFNKGKIANILPVAQVVFNTTFGVSDADIAALDPDTTVRLSYPTP